MLTRFSLTLLVMICAGGAAVTAADSPLVVRDLSVQPAEFTLRGPRSAQQVVVTANPASRDIHDVTHRVDWSVDNPSVAVVRDGLLTPVGDGTTTLRVRVGEAAATAVVHVVDFASEAPVDFSTDVLAALTKAGCNMGACHGSPSGKGGFRLSLRGYDPELDLLTLRGEFFNRRSSVLSPDDSLLLKKPLMLVAHGGGRRLSSGDVPWTVLRQWISEGMRAEAPEVPRLERIELLPQARILMDGADRQQLIVNGHFSDGSVRDVTALTAFDSSDEGITTVSRSGVARREGRGEATVLARYLDRMATTHISFLTDREGFQWTDPPVSNRVDELVFAKLRQLQIQPSAVCSDSDYLRRVTLDLAGRLPRPEESRAFLKSTDSGKRAALVDRLLATEDYARFWSLKWADLLRCNSRRMGQAGVHKFRRWLYEVVRDDMPMDEFVDRLLTATGSMQHNPAAWYWSASRDEIDATESTAQLFLGIRIQCARCHNHPFEKWTQDDYYGIAAAFKRVGYRPTGLPDDDYVFVRRDGEVTQPRTGETMKVRLLLQGDVDVPADQDRRAVFADWLTNESNPFFAPSLANRVWGHLFGRGIVDPVDDFRDSNPPSNPELLDYLAQEFVAGDYSTRHLIRTITASTTYQLSAERNAFNDDDDRYFSHATTRLLSAEQLLDAICFVTGVPESFSGVPVATPAVALADPPEDHKFLEIFGQPRRELPCQCERSTDSNLSQALQLINGPTVHNKLRSEQGNLHRWIQDGLTDAQIVEQLYLRAVSRFPTDTERATSLAHVAAGDDRTRALEDVAWAVINSKEFLFQH